MIVMDADLQDPPEVILDLIARWQEGFEVVYARRLIREAKAASSAGPRAFYRLLRLVTAVDIPLDIGRLPASGPEGP